MNHEDTVEGSVQGLAVPNQINDHLDLLVDYDCIENAGNCGIWNRNDALCNMCGNTVNTRPFVVLP